ncbi:MAG: hypothetical protein JW772_01925 [Candidatus Diapherotrites archaeon]|nr:hypothetical protein [Candidatus Diapherotrites archaeon]
MGLESFIQSARKNTPQLTRPFLQQTSQKLEPKKNFEETKISFPKKEPVSKPGNGDSTIFVAKDSPNFLWKDCPHVKKTTSNVLCKKFFSLCAKEKCKDRYAYQ